VELGQLGRTVAGGAGQSVGTKSTPQKMRSGREEFDADALPFVGGLTEKDDS